MRQTESLHDRLAEFASEARQEAADMPGGPERDKVVKKVRQAETASAIEGWAKLPELQAPK